MMSNNSNFSVSAKIGFGQTFLAELTEKIFRKCDAEI